VAGLTSELNLILLNMKIGEISEPVLATKPDGTQAYVIYRLDNRIAAHAANLKDDYEIFKQVSESDAKQKETDKWVRKRIANTFIKVNDEFELCTYQFPWLKNKP
jgi:peptidyl-prolyl cis-trans isomerase SurA